MNNSRIGHRTIQISFSLSGFNNFKMKNYLFTGAEIKYKRKSRKLFELIIKDKFKIRSSRYMYGKQNLLNPNPAK